MNSEEKLWDWREGSQYWQKSSQGKCRQKEFGRLKGSLSEKRRRVYQAEEYAKEENLMSSSSQRRMQWLTSNMAAWKQPCGNWWELPNLEHIVERRLSKAGRVEVGNMDSGMRKFLHPRFSTAKLQRQYLQSVCKSPVYACCTPQIISIPPFHYQNDPS